MTFEARAVGRVRLGADDRVVLDRAELSGEDFSRRKLVQFSAVGSKLVGCRFDKVKIDSAAFGAGRLPSLYTDCTFDGARIRFAAGGYARFERCSFRNVDLRDWFTFAVELVDCTFSGRLRKCVFNGTVPEDDRPLVGRETNEIRGNDFSAADLVDVSFRTGVELSRQRLPDSGEYLFVADAAAAVLRARREVAGWDDLALRKKAMGLVATLESTVQGGQKQLLIRRSTFAHLPAEAVDPVFNLLTA